MCGGGGGVGQVTRDKKGKARGREKKEGKEDGEAR